MATAGVAAEVSSEKLVQEETGELLDRQCPPLKLEKELSGNLVDNVTIESEVKMAALLNGAMIGDVDGMNDEVSFRKANQSMSEDSPGDNKHIKSTYLGNLGCSEGEDFTKLPSNIQVSLDAKIEGKRSDLDKEISLKMGKEMVESDTSCNTNSIGEIEKKDENEEREHSSEANEKGTFNANPVQKSGEWSLEDEKEAKVHFEEALEPACKQEMKNNVEEDPLLAVKDLNCLNLKEEVKEIAISNYTVEIGANNKTEVLDFDKEASETYIDRKCVNLVGEYSLATDWLEKDEQKKVEEYSYTESDEIGHAILETNKNGQDKSQKDEAEVHTYICKSPTPHDCPNAPLKESSCSNETDKAPAVEQEMNLNILAHDVMVLKQKFGDGGLQDGGRQEMDTVSDVNKKDDELEDTQEKQSSEDILHSVASHVTNLQNADKKIKDTEEEIIQMDDGIQEADIGEEGKANGFKLKTVLRENEGTSITKVDTGDGKVEDGLNLASEAKQPETIEANEKILLNNNAGEEIQNTQSFEGQKVEVKEPCETVDKNILEPTTINNSEEKPVRDKSTDDIQDENLQCDVIRDGLQETSQRTEEKQPVTLLQTEVEHRRDQDDSSTVYTEVDGSEVENQRKQRSLNGEMHVQGISKKDKELNGETEKSQDTDLHQDNNLDDGDIVKSTDTGRIKENTSTEKFETAEPLEQLFNTNKGTITLGHDVQNEQTTDAIDLDTSSSEQTTEEKFLMSNQENWKDEAVPNQINKKDKSNKENDSDVVDSKTDECKNMQGTDFQFKQKLNQAGADCEPYDAQQDVGLISIASSTGEVSGFPKSNIEQSKSTEDHKEASLIACGLEDENGKKHDSYLETLPLGGNPAEKHVQAEPICSKQEEEIRSNKNIDVADGLADCQERIKIWDLDEQTKSALKTNEMIEQESNETSALVGKEDKTQESNPDKNNALLSVTQESVEKTLEKEHDILQKEVTWSDTQETIHEISSMTIETMCENNEKSYAESQPTSQRIEVYESMSYSPGKEQYEPEIDQEASSTVIKDVGKNHKTADEVAENKVYPDINIYAQDIPEDGKDDTMQEISLPPDHLTFNEDIMILKDNEVLKVKSDRKFQPLSSLQHTEDKCHLNTQLKNGNIAPASEITEQDDEPHKVVNLCDKNSHDEKSNILSMSDAQADNRHSQTDTQEYSKLINTESSEVAKINQGALETNPEQSETKERIDDGNSNVNIIKVETDEQKLDHEQEPLSHVGDAAGGGINTERKHVYKDPKCSEELGLTSQEREEGRGGKLEEEAGLKKPEKQESYKHDDSRKEIENVRTTDNTEISEQENKRTYDLEVKNEECTDGSNTHQGIPDELVEENIKQTLNHQEDDFREEINDAEDTQEGTISGEKRTEDPTEINGEHMGNANAIENADRKTVSSQTSEQDNLSEETRGALTEKTEMITISGKEEQNKISHSNVDDELVEETHDQTPNDTGLMSEDTMDAAKNEMKVTIDSEKEHSEEEELNVDTMVATTEETNIPTVLEQEDKETCDIKEINKELTIETKASFNITSTLVEEAGKQTPNNEESSKQHDLSEDTNPINATTEKTNEQIILEQEDRGTDDIKETDEDHKGESKASFKITDRLVEESSKQDNKSGNTTNATTEETNMPTVPKHEDRGADEIKKTNEEFDDETKSSFNINHELVEEAGKQTSNYQEDSEPDDLREDTPKTTIENVDMPIIQGQDDRGTNDTKGTNEGCEDESKLIEEISKQTLDNQESSKQDDLNGNTTNATTEETNEPIVLIQEDRATENLKEKNEEIKIESVAFINISDEMVKEAGTQTSDNQGSYKQDDVSRDTTNATTEETNVHTILKQEDRATDDLKDINKGHKDESKASFSIIDELVDNTGKQASDSQESSKQDDLSGDTSPATAEQTNNPTVPEQKDRGTEDIKDTNEECKDESKASFNITEKSDEEVSEEMPNKQERTKPDDPRGDTTEGTIEEISIPIIQQQEDRATENLKEKNEEIKIESVAFINISDEMVKEAGTQTSDNQGSYKQDDVSRDTTNATTEETNVHTILKQEDRATDDLKDINKGHKDESKASFSIIDELVDNTGKQASDSQESSKQDDLSGDTSPATAEQTNNPTVPEQKDRGTEDIKDTNEECKDESKASFNITEKSDEERTKPDDPRGDTTKGTIEEISIPIIQQQEDREIYDTKEINEGHNDESNGSFNIINGLIEEASKQPVNNQGSSKPYDSSKDTTKGSTEDNTTSILLVQEERVTDHLKETNKELTDESKASFNIADELVEDSSKQTPDNQESSKQDELSGHTTIATMEETNKAIVLKQEDNRIDDVKETSEEHKGESKASFSITDELVGEAGKQTPKNQEISKPDDLRVDITNATIKHTSMPVVPRKEDRGTDDSKETNEEHKDESKASFNSTDELVEEAVKQMLDGQESSKPEDLRLDTINATIEETNMPIVQEQDMWDRGINDIKETDEECKDKMKASFNITDELVEEAGKQSHHNQESSEPYDSSKDTTNANTEETKMPIVPMQENLNDSSDTTNTSTEDINMPIVPMQEDMATDDHMKTNKELTDESKVSFITNEMIEEASKQMLDSQESSKQDDLSGSTTNASKEKTYVPITLEKKNSEADDIKEANEECKDESKDPFNRTDELVEGADKQTCENQEDRGIDDIKDTKEENKDENKSSFDITDKLVEEAGKHMPNNQEGSKPEDLREDTIDATIEETSMPIILGQEDRGTDDTKEINEECKDESKASLSITDELDEEAGKQMPNNQESCKLYDSNKDITYESTEEDNVPIIPKKEDKEISGLQEPKEELTDESKAYFSITDELVVEAGKQTLDIQEISKPDVPGEERENALAEDSKDKTVPEQEINRTRNETIEEHIDEDNLNDKSIDEAVRRTLDNQESSKQDAMNGETKSDLTEETKEVTVSDREVDPNPASNSLSEDKESKEKTDDVPSMDNRLPVDTEEAAEQVLSEGMAEELATKEKSVSPASDVPGSAGTSHEAKDVEMASANSLAAAVVANAEEGSNSAFITSIPDTAGPENHGEEHKTQEFDHSFSVKTEQNANSDEDNESKGRFLENFDATVGSNQEMETKACQYEGQNKPSTQELPLDGATAAEMNKLSHDSPSNVPKDEESNFPQEESITTIAMDEGEAVLDEEGDKQKMSSVMSVLDNEATVGDATLRRAEEFEDKAVLSTEIDLTNSKDETTFQEVHVLAVSEVPNAMACAKDASGIFQDIKAEERSEIQTCKEASVAEKSPTEEGKERKITEVETHDQANSGTPESDTDKEMAVDYLPVSQYLIDRIMREEDAKRETVVQEGIEDGQEVVDSMGKGLEISTDTQERTEELVLDETDAEPNSKANSLPAMLTSVEDAKMEVFLYDMIDIIPHKDGICELTGKAETRSESESEQTDLGTGTHGQSDSTPEVMQLKTTLDNNGALAKDPESPSVAEPVNNEILREEKNKRYEESIDENPSDELLEEVITKEHSRETTVTPEIKNFTRNIENRLETQEPSRTVIAVNQVEDCLEFAAGINEIDVTSKLSGIPETQIEGSAGRTKLLDLDETHSLGSEKDATGHDNQIAESMLKEKSFAINGNELDKEEIDTPAGTDETKDIFGVDESPLKTQEPSTSVPQENQLVQDAVEFFAPAEKERKSQMGDVNNKIDDLKAHSVLEEQNEREILLGEKHPPELEKKSKDDNTWVIDDTHDEKNTAISVGEAGEEPVDVQVHEDVTCEEVEKDADENEFDKLDTDATMMENKEEEPKTEHKKSHNLLSGVRSKVKHSISKVKKAITGKSSHSKTTPAK